MELAAVRVSLSTDVCAAHAARVVVLVTIRQNQEECLRTGFAFLQRGQKRVAASNWPKLSAMQVILANNQPMVDSPALDRLPRCD